MGHPSDNRPGGNSSKGGMDPAAKRTAQRPEPPGEASGSAQEATRDSASGEKVHGEKLQSASGNRSSGGSQSSQGSQSGTQSGSARRQH